MKNNDPKSKIQNIINTNTITNTNTKKVNVIDGPSGAGKSTVSKILANKLGYEYISTGAMYRLVGLISDEMGIFNNNEKVKELCENIGEKIFFKNGRIYYKGEDYTEKIYENRVSMLASEISKRKVVRSYLGKLQREIGLKQPSILEGRDIGTVIFPDAKYKFFLDASPEKRAERRYKELKEKGENVDYEKILEEIIKRDKNDSERELAPLKKADDAIYIDTSEMTIDEVIDTIIDYIKSEKHKNRN